MNRLLQRLRLEFSLSYFPAQPKALNAVVLEPFDDSPCGSRSFLRSEGVNRFSNKTNAGFRIPLPPLRNSNPPARGNLADEAWKPPL